MQHVQIVGVGGEDVRRRELGQPLGRQHRAGIDAQGAGAQRAARVAEDGAERALGDRRNLADQVELIVVQPASNPRVQVRHHDQRLGGEESGLDAEGHHQRVFLGALLGPPIGPHRRLAHQLVGRDTDREREAEPLAHLAPDPHCDVLRGTEEPAGAGEIQEGMPVAVRLDHGRIGAEDLVQRP